MHLFLAFHSTLYIFFRFLPRLYQYFISTCNVFQLHTVDVDEFALNILCFLMTVHLLIDFQHLVYRGSRLR